MARGILISATGFARRLAPWLLLLALLLRGMIPAGYMPNMDPGIGKGWLVICTGVAAANPSGDDDNGGAKMPADTGHAGLCPFMAVTLLGPVLLLLVSLLPRMQSRPILWNAAAIPGLRRLLCGPALGARAPPLSWAV